MGTTPVPLQHCLSLYDSKRQEIEIEVDPPLALFRGRSFSLGFRFRALG
jgi:hypothetical protein